jgi:hypothetical protein
MVFKNSLLIVDKNYSKLFLKYNNVQFKFIEIKNQEEWKNYFFSNPSETDHLPFAINLENLGNLFIQHESIHFVDSFLHLDLLEKFQLCNEFTDSKLMMVSPFHFKNQSVFVYENGKGKQTKKKIKKNKK